MNIYGKIPIFYSLPYQNRSNIKENIIETLVRYHTKTLYNVKLIQRETNINITLTYIVRFYSTTFCIVL